MSPASTYFWLSSTTKHKAAAEKLIEWFTTPQYFLQQTNEMYYPAPNAEQLLAQGKITYAPLKDMVRTYAKVNVIPPNPASVADVAETQAIQATLPTPSPNWNQIMEGAIGGRLANWQQALAKVTQEYNGQLAQAIKQENAKGGKVTQKDFAFPSWNGTSNYSGT
jgi:ABC-type glycerol-3-phosphate transport system substrate-binding protein